jgi:virginiamycin B lyase
MGPARSSRAMLALSFALASLLLAAPAATATITEFPLPAGSAPGAITAGPDGALWFTESPGPGVRNARIGRITTAGTVTEFPIPTANAFPSDITRGPDGALWFTEGSVRRIGRVTTGGSGTEFAVSGATGDLRGITAGPDGALWFTATEQVGRITTSGSVTLFSLSGGDARDAITAGPDGALWFTEQNANRIGRITTSGTITSFPVPTPESEPLGIVAGPDGALWFTEPNARKIGRITTGGAITEFPIRTQSYASQITAGPDGALWFGGGKVGRITTSGMITDFLVPSAEDIAAGPDGALWFTEGVGRIGRITTDQPAEDAVDGEIYTLVGCDPFQPVGCTQPNYGFSTASDASGAHPRGTVRYQEGERIGLARQRGPVTCLRVEGNRASIGVEFNTHFGMPLSPRAALIVVEDNGPVEADRFAVHNLPPGTAPTACPSPAGVALGPAFGYSPALTDAGVVVTDARPPARTPTSKEQCKDGGWRAFGFRNQGQCIAFVERGPKPPKP